MKSKHFKKEFDRIRKELIAEIKEKVEGLKLEFVHAIEYNTDDEHDPELLNLIDEKGVTVSDSCNDRRIKFSKLDDEMLILILEELENDSVITYSKEITE